MQAVLDRARECNPHLNAIVYERFDAALERSREADAARASGESWGPLHGVPVTIKENVDVAGMPTPNGVRAFEGVVAPDDSPVVRNLLAAGAIVIGRTTTPEFSMRASTDSPLHGRTRNPW
ncbi:MAG: amidase, partial [Azorhizobium sp. 12-66-6]